MSDIIISFIIGFILGVYLMIKLEEKYGKNN